MNAAIYARKSTKQEGVREEDKSVGRQVENARAFAAKKGWTVLDAHVFVDDGVSGAEFANRPAWSRLMAALKPKPPFSKLIVSEQKSIGREMSETGYVIKQLAQADVEIFEYVHGQSLTPRTAADKLMSSVQGYSDEDHREKTRERVHEAHTRLHKLGRVTGGRVFGYRNVHIYKGEDQHGNRIRSHTEREIDPAEAAVVRSIYELYDSGVGLKGIAKRLRAEQAPKPKPFKRKDPNGLPPVIGWSPSTVRTILSRDIYRGVPVWNKSRKRDDWGQLNQRRRPESEWLRTPTPQEHLRIISDDLWNRVASRRGDTEGRTLRFGDGRMCGRPPKKGTPNLLAGLATCGSCGGSLVVETSPRKRGRIPEYVCYRHRHNGSCENALRVSVAEMNEAVLQAIEEHALTLEAIEQVIQLTERDDVRDQQAGLLRERKDVQKRINHLVAAIAEGAAPSALVAKLRELETRRTAIDRELADIQPIPRLAPTVIENRLAEWRRLLRQSTTQARAVLQRVIRGRITFTLEGVGYTFEAETRYDKLFIGLVTSRAAERRPGRQSFIDPNDRTGCEGLVPSDEDYGRLLERAHRLLENRGKRLASPAGAVARWCYISSWNQPSNQWL